MSIDTAHVQQYSANVTHRAQQKGSKLEKTVEIKTGVVGEYTFMEQLSKGEATKISNRHGDTPLVDEEFLRRRITMFDYDFARLVDDADKLKTIINPTSSLVVNGAWAIGRAKDDEIIAAALGTAYTGKAGGTSTSFDTANNQIAHGSVGLTISKILQAKDIIEGNDVDDDEPRFLVCSSQQINQDLLNTTEVKSIDYNTVKALAEGRVNTFAGFKFLRTQRLDKSGTTRSCLAYVKSALGLAIAQEMKTRVTERADKRYATQVYLSVGIGSSRLDEEKIVEVQCTES